MKIKHIIPYLLAFTVLAGTIFAVSSAQVPIADQPFKETRKKPVQQEMRGVWVTFMTLDTENEADKKAAFEQKTDEIIKRVKTGGFNTLFVQVRPFCDALYPSDYYPWSHIISGVQGKDPGFDPLRMICDKCAAADIRVHAWINPYRIRTESTPPQLCEDHPYTRDSSIGVVVNGETYLNPADSRTRKLIVSGVIELLKNYALDGIQFDDYFYPENCGDFDKADYEAYQKAASSPLPLDEFRKENVNQLIREVYQAVHNTDPDAVFGISPQGNIGNNDALYADVRRWCAEKGYIDYICPQLYYSLDNPAQRFEDALSDWMHVDRHSGLSVYIGLGGYKAGTDADEGTWLDNDDILRTEVGILRNAGCGGFLLFSYDSMISREQADEIAHLTDYINSAAQ